jgi:hypothetical protein
MSGCGKIASVRVVYFGSMPRVVLVWVDEEVNGIVAWGAVLLLPRNVRADPVAR